MSWPFTFEGLFIVIHQIYDSDLSNEGLPTLTREEMTCLKVQLEKVLLCSCYRTMPSEIWEIFSKLFVFCNFTRVKQ